LEEKLAVKVNAPQILEKELQKRARKAEHGFIIFSSATEAWQSIEQKYKLTRKMLQIVKHYKFPVHALTKSPLVLRDLDILREIDETAILPKDLKNKLDHKVLITFSISSLDEEISRNLSLTLRRLRTAQGIAKLP